MWVGINKLDNLLLLVINIRQPLIKKKKNWTPSDGEGWRKKTPSGGGTDGEGWIKKLHPQMWGTYGKWWIKNKTSSDGGY